jgi:hypothetical protein
MADKNFIIKDDELPSAIYGGTAKKESNIFDGIGNFFNKLFEKITPQPIKDFFTAIKMFKDNPKEFFDGWVNDSPIGAAAGVLAAGLSGGMLLLTGGTLVGMIGKLGLMGITKLTALGGGIGGAFSGIMGAITGSGLIGKAIAFVTGGFVLSNLIRFGVRAASFLWNFNWNITDKEIEAQQKSLMLNIVRQAGATVGATIGSLVCGTIPIALIKSKGFDKNNPDNLTKLGQQLKINPQFLAELKYLNEFVLPRNADGSLDISGDIEAGEIYEEMVENMKALINITARSVSQAFFLEAFKNVRRLIKWGAKITGFEKIPFFGPMVKKWGEEGSKSWSFARAVEDAIESIPIEPLREFLEEALEEFQDVCSENLLIISYSV